MNLNLIVFTQEIIYLNLDEYKSAGTHWLALYANTENVTYFDSFGIEHVP